MFCDGSTFSKDEYPELYAVLESTILPNLEGRFLEGSSIPRTQKEAGLPEIFGWFHTSGYGGFDAFDAAGDAFFQDLTLQNKYCASTHNNNPQEGKCYGLGFSAKRYNSIYGNSSTVQPKSYTVRYLIRAK